MRRKYGGVWSNSPGAARISCRSVLYSKPTQRGAAPVRSNVCDCPGGPFTKYLTTILGLSYDNAIVTIDLQQVSISENILR